MENNSNLSKQKAYLTPVIITILLGLLFLFLPAGSLKFWEAWVYWIGFSGVTFFITAYFLNKSPIFSKKNATP